MKDMKNMKFFYLKKIRVYSCSPVVLLFLFSFSKNLFSRLS